MKLLTWNIQWCRGCDGRVDPERIVRDAHAFADFDVLCLQEVAANFSDLAGSLGENQFQLLAELLPQYTAVPGAAVDIDGLRGKRQVFGNLIFSRLPVLRVLRLQLPWPYSTHHEGMPRMLLEATVQTGHGPLRVMTTHLEYYSATQRAAQVGAIRARHAEACVHARHALSRKKENGPFKAIQQPSSAILTGDFNFKPEDALWKEIQSAFDDHAPPFRDTWTQLHPDRPHPYTIGVHDRAQWPQPYACDFIFATEDLLPRIRRVEVEARTRASDHQPLLVELE
ncbi:MAG TPA: endonuclease/exonuclease/phosphatase family protein [Burkholderiales bacterium]|nr:endonuclease/exonuclease/phosphatase family protein [Burkholderiales bacterium]